MLTSDKAGDLNFRTNTAHLSLAGRLYFINKRQVQSYLSLGFQFGYVTSSFDQSAIRTTFPNQIVLNYEQSNYLDAGIGGTYVYTTKKFLIYLGSAIFHLHKPIYSFGESNQYHLSPRYVGHLGGEFKISNGFTFLPSALYQQQGTTSELVIGGFLKLGHLQTLDDVNLLIGSWYRWNDAFIVSFRYQTNNLMVTFSYDANTSTLVNASNGFGALEISATYFGIYKNRKKNRKKIRCPSF